jgi:regulator of nucleoside diphosphate kinase
MTEAMSDTRTIYVTRQDKTRLEALLGGPISGRNQEAAEALESELVQAKVVAPEEIPADVVTMNSKVRFVDEGSADERVVTLVYPRDSDPAEGKISVLAPVGAALLGLSVGQRIEWPVPGGRVKRLRIAEVLYQPEAAGDSDL